MTNKKNNGNGNGNAAYDCVSRPARAVRVSYNKPVRLAVAEIFRVAAANAAAKAREGAKTAAAAEKAAAAVAVSKVAILRHSADKAVPAVVIGTGKARTVLPVWDYFHRVARVSPRMIAARLEKEAGIAPVVAVSAVAAVETLYKNYNYTAAAARAAAAAAFANIPLAEGVKALAAAGISFARARAASEGLIILRYNTDSAFAAEWHNRRAGGCEKSAARLEKAAKAHKSEAATAAKSGAKWGENLATRYAEYLKAASEEAAK